jgi:CRP/FNR family cyclic AMP-dependent transcriptional regulator
MGRIRAAGFDAKTFLTKARTGRAPAVYREKQVIFAQGDPADAVFYLESGQVKLTVVAQHGKSAVLAILGHGDFFGEGCLAGQPFRMTAASAMTEVSVVRVEKQAMIGLLHERSIFSERVIAHLLARFGKEGKTEPMIPKISQTVLAEMVGTTRPFMSKFRKLGFIEYNDGLHIHSSLLNVLLHEEATSGIE